MASRLTVAEGDGPDARLPPAALDTLGVDPGDALAVEGRRRTGTRALLDADAAPGTIGLDESVRSNAGADPGDTVRVEPLDPEPAARVELAPLADLDVRGGVESIERELLDRPVTAGDTIRASLLNGALDLPFRVVETDPAGTVLVTADTGVTVRDDPGDAVGVVRRPPPVSYDEVAGHDDAVAVLRDAVELPLEHPEVFDRLGERPARGVLLHGPDGVGKTLLARAVATETAARAIGADGTGLASLSASDAVDRLRGLPERVGTEPTVVLLDDVDAIARRDRTASALRGLLDALAASPAVVVGTAAVPDDVDPSLRRGGRFDREIELDPPDRSSRTAHLGRRLDGIAHDGVDPEAVAARTGGYVGADLDALVRAAVLHAVDRLRSDDAVASVDDLVVVPADFDAALDDVTPSAMREVAVAVPDVTWDDVGGLADVRRDLVRAVEWPLRHPDLFERFATAPPAGVLLYGPPGTGKTLLARAVANATDANFIAVKGPELLNKYVGESERAVRETFDQARRNAPAVVFFDEVDALSPERSGDASGSGAPERVVSQLLTELDGLEPLEDVVVIAATNRPDVIDPALLRPGRLERAIEVPVPDPEAREAIFRVHLRDAPTTGADPGDLAARTEGYTGSDIEAVVREASLLAMADYVNADGATEPSITAGHLDRALDRVGPSLTPDTRRRYEAFGDALGGSADDGTE